MARALIDFLRDAGGLRDTGGNLAAMGHAKYVPCTRLNRAKGTATQYARGLINPRGIDLDRAREMAAEAGYLEPDIDRAVSETTVTDLLDALDPAGPPVYSIFDSQEIEARERRAEARKRKEALARAREEISDYLSGLGGSADDIELIAAAADIMVCTGCGVDSAIDSACIALEGEYEARGDELAAAAGLDSFQDQEFWPEPEPATELATEPNSQDPEIAVIIDAILSRLDRLMAAAVADFIAGRPGRRRPTGLQVRRILGDHDNGERMPVQDRAGGGGEAADRDSGSGACRADAAESAARIRSWQPPPLWGCLQTG